MTSPDNLVLPDGWELTQVGAVIKDMQPGFASGRHNSSGEGLPHLRPMNVSTVGKIDRTVVKYVDPQLADRSERRLRRGDVLFNNTNSLDLVGKTAYFDDDDTPAFSNHMTRLRTEPERVLPEYLARYLHGCWLRGDFTQLANNHVSQASVSRKVLSGLPLPLPPLTQQRQIIELLDQIDQGRDAAAASLAKARRLLTDSRRAVLASACSGQLTENWREDNRLEPVGPKLIDIRVEQSAGRGRGRTAAPNESELPELPNTWAWASVGEVAEVQVGGTPSRKVPEYWGGQIPWVSSGEVANCRISATREGITESGLANSNAKIFPAGTVLIAMIGEGKTRGQAAILDVEASNNQNAAGVLANVELIDPEYLWRWALAQYEVTRAVGRGKPAGTQCPEGSTAGHPCSTARGTARDSPPRRRDA